MIIPRLVPFFLFVHLFFFCSAATIPEFKGYLRTRFAVTQEEMSAKKKEPKEKQELAA